MSQKEDLPTIFDPQTLVRKGLCPVMALQGQAESAVESHSLYFEQHGTGTEKVVFIMGLNTSSFAWNPQVQHFARTHSVLVLDNRGVGNSDTPKGPYTISQMADDVIAVLDYIGWKNKRELHIVGVSMGGMISQELALKIPERILSLSLIATKPGSAGFFANLTPWFGTISLVRATFAGDDNKKADVVMPMLYPEEWLNAKSEISSDRKTNREVAKTRFLNRIGIERPQTFAGMYAQTTAARAHNVTPERLQEIGKKIPKVFILTGDADHLMKPINSEWLHNHIPDSEYQVWKGSGHALIEQLPARFNETLERVFKEGREKATQAPWA
ncbi:hypothetical protein M408DRAFT_21017 [Serendipita vermifera MAFF 305830]|uniref:AB hydrolase-1 domain-containing protein n=1 Tax=Serendipita vermifera MAFF 305830 TaxID=933852 RepID=A0A0C3B4N6_SERVB|nr:hypothetical protein M408DRAFT_21017 [Serendipita vermifera MAFF 305830]